MMGGDIPIFEWEQVQEPGFLSAVMEAMAPSGLLNHLDRHRPYDGQPQTMEGERGSAQPSNITMRDVYDCYLIGAFLASGLPLGQLPGSVYDLPWSDMDPIAVMQCACVVLGHRAGLKDQPSRCVFCSDEFPDYCPPELHAHGDQAPTDRSGS